MAWNDDFKHWPSQCDVRTVVCHKGRYLVSTKWPAQISVVPGADSFSVAWWLT
ncbi:hypothetical protein LOAG_05519 [Loa loa]|uniref:Transposase n=1 Tax=Loa loa TaxID=7209 RepID=A0A1I7W5G2_LOALO|nr:hypothetical protein LOAG_05519 [Loa loa]EFO22965.1 hypothetical protein LOAG_05519 [Loa loa]